LIEAADWNNEGDRLGRFAAAGPTVRMRDRRYENCEHPPCHEIRSKINRSDVVDGQFFDGMMVAEAFAD
jgi:DNA-binding cell septation regulator SpoVG